MNRRDFLHLSSLGGSFLALAPLLPLGACSCSSSPTSATTASEAFALEEMTLLQLQEAMREGRYTARALTQLYLDRIEELNPKLNAVLEVNPEALQIAEALDQERKDKGERGPLHGIPVLLKDNIDTGDQMKTTAGSLALANHVAQKDAFLVQRLREAGAIILGKTNLSEWANFRSDNSSSGWSGRGGQTHNPYILDRNPCGSSSGSGVAVSANLCAAAIGTETDGSIVCPSTTNGVVGLKPTLGLVSRSGIIPIAHSQDTAGPMTRTVADAALMLSAMTGVDAADEATAASNGKSQTDYTKFLDAKGLNGARIGVARQFFGFDAEVDELMEDALEVLRQQGAVLVDPVSLETRGQWGRTEYDVLLYEFKHDLNAYLKTVGPDVPVKTLEDLIAYNKEHASEELPWFGQETFLEAQKKGELSDTTYQNALARNLRLTRDEGIDATLQKHQLDAIVAPTGGPAWVTDLVNGDHFGGGSSSAAAVSGYPNLTVPAGFIHGLPVGISFFSTAWSEPTLIRLAYAYEQASKHRRPPQFFPTLEQSIK
ncbi:amidase [Catalinimonas alkaloidigena]|uniref:Amidase n=1 Tax=Catalinimonas alkaloidigena TaxID=1075417 RepID=A0A1G9A8B2_9BACT|nr:amidase [Catalinimonas alkaloidigena]SDK23596.1 amidase [Catalinimonas alkaloidigena]